MTPTEPQNRKRYRTPLAIVLLTAIALPIIQHVPLDAFEEMQRNFVCLVWGFSALCILALWALFRSGWSKGRVLLGMLALAVLLGSAFKLRHFDGDFAPVMELRGWLAKLLGVHADDRLEANRQANRAASPKATLDATNPNDWPGYRNADRTGVYRGPAIRTDWDTRPPKLLWKQPVGKGWAGFGVVSNYLFTIEQRRDQETVTCYEADSGREVWATGWAAEFQEPLGGPGPRATPTVFNGCVYALGATGHLACLDAATGRLLWEKELLASGGNLTWAMSGSPLIVDDLVIVCPGVRGGAVQAFRQTDGSLAWATGDTPAGYASPMRVTLNDTPQILVFDGTGLASHDLKNGTRLWYTPWKTNQDINVAQPLVIDSERVFISSGYGVGGALYRITTEATQVWKTNNRTMRCKFTSPVFNAGFIYGLNDGKLECIDAKTGQATWTDDRRSRAGEAYGHGQILLCGQHILVTTEFGEIVLVKANPERFEELHRFKNALDAKRNPCWNNPALVKGKLYIRNAVEMACYDIAGP
jgi:outer membrane protein assembly factor BamB